VALLAGILLAATPVAATSAATPHLAEIERASFEICPKVIDRSLDLGSETDAKSIGYRLSAPHAQRSNVEMGSGEDAIVIWGPLKDDPKAPACIVTFAAPQIVVDFDAVDAMARRHGFVGGPTTKASPKARLLQLSNGTSNEPNFFMLEVAGGTDYLDYPTAILVMTTEKDR
jgi:hypothetical protein